MIYAKNKTIYELELHERLVVVDGNFFTECLRVASGWIYITFDKSHNMLSSVFVPFDNNFMEAK